MKSVTIGLVPAPQLPTEIVEKIIDDLKKDLNNELPDSISFNVEMKIDRLTGAADSVDTIIDEANHLKKEYNWDYAISLTDLPIFHEKAVVIADADIEGKNALISLPAYGITPTAKKVKRTMIHLVKEIYYQNFESEENIEFIQKGIGINEDAKKGPTFDKFKNLFKFTTIKRVNMSKDQKISTRFIIKPKWTGLPKILSGMTIANEPWTIMPSFKKVVGLAFATGTYMLIFTTLWELSSLYGLMRHILVMVFAIIGMTVWTIIAHNLWEKNDVNNPQEYRLIYNLTTVLTLLVSIIIFYIFLFSLFLVAVIIFVPPDMFEKVINTEVEVVNYLKLVWLITSASTIAGAIGAGLENAELVRKSTYGYRQYIRTKAIDKNKQEEEKYTEK